MFPYPISLHLCPTFLPIATLAPASAQTGLFSEHLTVFFPSSFTDPTVAAALTFSINSSPNFMGSTTSLSFAPTTLSSKCVSSVNSYQTLSELPSSTTRLPTSLSLLTTLGSNEVIIAMLPPGIASFIFSPPDMIDVIVVFSGFHIFWFFSCTSYPGSISISAPCMSFPCFIAPPNTPPTIFSGSAPGLFMSKLLATNIIGSAAKSLFGVGKFSCIVCISTSKLIECIALIGMIGAFSNFVPLRNSLISL